MNLPIDLPEGSRILVAGAGGGFDVVCALPVAFALKKMNMEVHLANYSFTHLSKLSNVEKPLPSLYGVSHRSQLITSDYCPEVKLAKWWKNKYQEDMTVWCYSGVGVKPLTQIFNYLQGRLDLDAILIFDGGVDGLFHGNEYNTGTPSMDAISVIAGSQTKNCKRFYGFTAFGTEGSNQEVRHVDALIRVSELIQKGAFLGVCAPKPRETEAEQFVDVLDYIHASMDPSKHSIMAGSIKCALEGGFGFKEINVKTKGAPIWISALTLFYWFFDLDSVASTKPIFDAVLETEHVLEVADAFEKVRVNGGIRPREDIPI